MAPPLIQLGLTPIAAHMFIFYFACLSMITPPVALAAYAAAGIAGSDAWKTGWIACMLAAGGFVIPFAFARNPALLLQAVALPDLVWLLISMMLGIFSLSAALIFLGPARWRWWIRPAYALAGFLLVDPGRATDTIGCILMLTAVLFSRYASGAARPAHRKNE